MNSSNSLFSSNKHAMVLACFAALVTVALTTTQHLTRERITSNEQQRLQKNLAELLPADLYDHPLQTQSIVIFDNKAQRDRICYIARSNGEPVATIITAVAENGYSGNIEMLVGILLDGTVSGVRITKHTETPGLGDAIELQRSSWILDFNNKSLSAPIESRWTVKKQGGEFDQFTGATITPRAVINEVKNTLHFFESAKRQLFSL